VHPFYLVQLQRRSRRLLQQTTRLLVRCQARSGLMSLSALALAQRALRRIPRALQ